VGIAAALLGAHVFLTDRQDILPSLQRNVEAHAGAIREAGEAHNLYLFIISSRFTVDACCSSRAVYASLLRLVNLTGLLFIARWFCKSS